MLFGKQGAANAGITIPEIVANVMSPRDSQIASYVEDIR
jgi:hypothetical protein